MTEVANRVAVVTGAGSGIGQGLAVALAKQGAQVVVADIVEAHARAVAGEIERSGGRAVDRANDRFRKPAKGADKRIVAFLERIAEIRPLSPGADDAIGQILPGAKAPASPGQQHGAAIFVRRGALDRARQRLMQRDIEGVQPLGPIQRQGQYAALERFEQNRLR